MLPGTPVKKILGLAAQHENGCKADADAVPQTNKTNKSTMCLDAPSEKGLLPGLASASSRTWPTEACAMEL